MTAYFSRMQHALPKKRYKYIITPAKIVLRKQMHVSLRCSALTLTPRHTARCIHASYDDESTRHAILSGRRSAIIYAMPLAISCQSAANRCRATPCLLRPAGDDIEGASGQAANMPPLLCHQRRASSFPATADTPMPTFLFKAATAGHQLHRRAHSRQDATIYDDR